MRTLAAIAFSFSAALALLCYLPEGAWAFWAAAGLAVLGGAALLLPALGKNKRLRLTLVLIALSLAAGLLYGRGWRHFIADPVREKCGGSHLFSATVCDWPQETDSGWRVTVRLTDARGAKAVCYLSDEAADLEPGQMLLGEAYWQDASVIRGRELSTFTARGVFVLLYCNTFPDVSPGSAGSVRYLPQHLARAMRDTIDRVWPDETAAAILRAELLGDRSGIDTALSSRFSEAGVSHLFAVSGLHCAFLLTLLSLLVGPQRRRLLAAVGIAVLTVYMLMVGLTPSVVRACIMQFFLLLAPLFLRDADPPTSLASALLVILLWNPYAAQSVSLQLSFGAMLGLILVTPRVHDFFAGRIRPGKKPVRAAVSFLLSTLCSTLGAMVFTVPLTAYYFGVFSTVAPLTSLLCIPLASWNFMAGFLTALLGFVFLPAAQVLGYVCRALTKLFLWVVDLACVIPYHALYTDTNPYLVWWLVFVYAVFLLCILSRERGRKYAFAAGVSVLTLVLCITLRTGEFRSDALTAVAVDVGQGASTLLRSGEDTILVDCGSSNRYKKPAQQVLSQLGSMGVERLSAVAVTHYHADHTNGLPELLERVAVDALYLPEIEDEYGVRDKLVTLAAEKNIRVIFVTEQTEISLGAATVTVFPPVGKGDMNEQGLTYLCTSGDFDLLITGDMSGPTELALTQMYKLPDVEVLLVGHHGSKYSSQQEFLSKIEPDAAIISVGDNNYGHPTDAAISRLEAAGATVYRTDRQGCVTVTLHKQ
mgnify:FL=1